MGVSRRTLTVSCGNARKLQNPCNYWGFGNFTRERATGIEPAFSAWEADVLPLNYTRVSWIGDPPSSRLLPLGKHSASGTPCGLAEWERESGRSMAIHPIVQ